MFVMKDIGFTDNKCYVIAEIAQAEHYQSVLNSPEDDSSHLNIRSFMKHGWKGLLIDFDALKVKI